MSNLTNLSDEDFLSAAPFESSNAEVVPAAENETVKEDEATADAVVTEPETETVVDDVADTEAEVAESVVANDAAAGNTVIADTATTVNEVVDKPVVAETKAVSAEEHSAFYAKVMAPFKANGKMIELKSPEEAIQLMQMGANYTRKMQAIQPHKKALMMLETAGLLDEGKLSYLIDLDKKNPEAIKKLIKEAGIDPIDIDTTSEPNYLEGHHRVSNEEAAFRTIMDEVGDSDEGKATLAEFSSWDHASKDLLWKSPDIMKVLHEQRESGIYATISAEVSRLRTIGAIPPDTPFLHAYKQVGDYMTQQAAAAPKAKAPVAVGVIQPKPAVKNSAQANAASPTRSGTRSVSLDSTLLNMSDDDFLKHMATRV